jgi:Flp pilus assembly protein TadD
MNAIFGAFRCRYWAAALLFLAAPAFSQTAMPPAGALPPSTDPADRLAANLVILSQNPRDVDALTEAGISAVAVGDGNAALGFLARAEELSPRNGRIKAALGAALLLLEKPSDALKLFGEASALGLQDWQIGKDRGLAYDLRGDSRRAQRDYLAALRHGADDEATRRLALSYGISGDRDQALKMLDPLLRKRDVAAWRARAFVLAMNGDLAGAEGIAASIMPGGSGASMTPFLRRLASLNAAERALAVNMGIMPSDGQRYAMVETDDPYRPSGSGASDTLIPVGDPLGTTTAQPAPGGPRAIPDSRDPRRRPGRETATFTPTRPEPPVSTVSAVAPAPQVSGGRINNRIGPVDHSRIDPAIRAILDPPVKGAPTTGAVVKSPAQVAILTDARSLPPPSGAIPAASRNGEVGQRPSIDTDLPPSPVFEVPIQTSTPQSSIVAPSTSQPALMGPPASPSAEGEKLAAVVSSQTTAPTGSAPIPPLPAPPAPAVPVVAPGVGLAAILATIEPEEESAAGPLPDAAKLRAARVAAQRKTAADGKAAEEAKAEKARKDAEHQAALKNPARIWVQVATGSNESGLPLTWKRLKEKAPDAFKGLSPASVRFKATNRLLVGPFKAQSQARAVVNQMAKAGISGFTFTSEAGQEIAKVASR